MNKVQAVTQYTQQEANIKANTRGLFAAGNVIRLIAFAGALVLQRHCKGMIITDQNGPRSKMHHEILIDM